jgi:hypothetical protein
MQVNHTTRRDVLARLVAVPPQQVPLLANTIAPATFTAAPAGLAPASTTATAAHTSAAAAISLQESTWGEDILENPDMLENAWEDYGLDGLEVPATPPPEGGNTPPAAEAAVAPPPLSDESGVEALVWAMHTKDPTMPDESVPVYAGSVIHIPAGYCYGLYGIQVSTTCQRRPGGPGGLMPVARHRMTLDFPHFTGCPPNRHGRYGLVVDTSRHTSLANVAGPASRHVPAAIGCGGPAPPHVAVDARGRRRRDGSLPGSKPVAGSRQTEGWQSVWGTGHMECTTER